jgi:hypothetical protein
MSAARLALRLAAAALGCSAAGPPPEAPGEVRARMGRALDPARGELTVEWAPALRGGKEPYTEYQFRTEPLGACLFKGLNPGYGGYYTGKFEGPPYRVTAECACARSYAVFVATAPAGPVAPRSEWTPSKNRVPVRCARR